MTGFTPQLTGGRELYYFSRVTIFIAVVVSIYAVSLCFVAVLISRALWRERSTPLAPADVAAPANSQPALPELRPAAKSA